MCSPLTHEIQTSTILTHVGVTVKPLVAYCTMRINTLYITLYADTSQYMPKTVFYFCKRTVLKSLCYQNIYAEKNKGEMFTA